MGVIVKKLLLLSLLTAVAICATFGMQLPNGQDAQKAGVAITDYLVKVDTITYIK